MPSSQIGFPGLGIPTGAALITVREETADYELVDDDLAGSLYLELNSASAITVTVPEGLLNGQPVNLTQTGAGQLEVVADGVTIQSTDNWTKARTRYSSLTLIPTGPDIYTLIGDLAE